jgi:hypothetical protein
VSAIPQDPTLQEVFDHVARHLLRQGERCTFAENGNGCAMTSRDMRCAVGSLLGPGEEAVARIDRYLNNSSIGQERVQALVANSLGLDFLHGLTVRLLDRLQGIHDLRSPDTWRTSLLAVAREWGFDTSALSDAKAVR